MVKCLQTETSGGVRRALRVRLVSETRGQELVEFAMVAVILVFLLIGVFWIARAVSVYQALGRAARDGARVALASTSASLGNTPNDPTAVINSALAAASLDPTQAIISVSSSPSTPLDSTSVPSDPAAYQIYAVTVTIAYPVQFNMAFLPGNGAFTITSTTTMRQEY